MQIELADEKKSEGGDLLFASNDVPSKLIDYAKALAAMADVEDLTELEDA